MRAILIGLVSLILCAGTMSRAEEQDLPREVVERAVAKHGGALFLDPGRCSCPALLPSTMARLGQ